MKINAFLAIGAGLILMCAQLPAQNPVGAIEGVVADSSGGRAAAHVVVRDLDTAAARETVAAGNGTFRLPQIPVGRYSVTVNAPGFATMVQQPVAVDISQNVRLQFSLALSEVQSVVDVHADSSLVDTSTNVLGAVVTAREIVDLPLNGRNFTQLGLLQSDVAPLPPQWPNMEGLYAPIRAMPSMECGPNPIIIWLTAHKT